MKWNCWWFAAGLSVLAVSSAGAQVTGGVLSATQTHMS
jgi:hypothetical protein